MKRICIYILFLGLIASCNNDNTKGQGEKTDDTAITNPAPAVLNYTIVNIFPHDTKSFTEGLLVHNGKLYESTGSPDAPENNGSWLGIVDWKTGQADKKVTLDKQYFGEGITIFKGKLYQLTWQNHVGFVYDAATYKKLQEFNYPGEGWALTHDSSYLIMSDGTSKLQYMDPATLKVVKTVSVEDNYGPVGNINELEYIDGYVYANQWQTNYILKIDPSSGKIVAKADLTNIATGARSKFAGTAEMNGIAWDQAARKLYITGKCWPDLYEIKFN